MGNSTSHHIKSKGRSPYLVTTGALLITVLVIGAVYILQRQQNTKQSVALAPITATNNPEASPSPTPVPTAVAKALDGPNINTLLNTVDGDLTNADLSASGANNAPSDTDSVPQ